jgi:hypothetical protein
MYLRTLWKDHVVQYPNRFTETPNGDGTTEHVASPGTTLQAGTSQDAAHFNNMEAGIAGMTVAFFLMYTLDQMVERDTTTRIETIEAALAAMA